MTQPVPHQYYLSVEEFIPRTSVEHMLYFADNLERLEPVQAKRAFIDIKRAMSWMGKYITPTSEFWDWTNDTFELDGETVLTIQLLGFGWAVAVATKHPCLEDQVSGVEKELIRKIDALTHHIPVRAVIRTKSSGWNKHELKELTQSLRIHGHPCVLKKKSVNFVDIGARIDVESDERLECNKVSRETDKKVSVILDRIKEYANKSNQGAKWCAYQRRRLTLITKIGSENLSQEDRRFLEHPEFGMTGELLGSKVMQGNNHVLNFYFIRSKYHTGNIHPRALIASDQSTDLQKTFATYVYYLWNSHFTRIWLYLLFEDAYVYADNLRSSKQYVDPKILYYWQNLLKTDEIITDMKIHERVESGEFQSYCPPHTTFSELPLTGFSADAKPIEWLRKFLIEATTTQLYDDPLRRAVHLLEDMDNHMKTALNLFVQTVDIRMQKTLQILQFLFVFAAVAQVLQLFSVGSIISGVYGKNIKNIPHVLELLGYLSITTPELADSVISILVNFIILIVLTALTILLFKVSYIKRFLDFLMR